MGSISCSCSVLSEASVVGVGRLVILSCVFVVKLSFSYDMLKYCHDFVADHCTVQ